MAAISMNTDQQARLQGEIQHELERREWAEPDDNVMAEYITVLLANGSSQERVQTEMDDLVGSDFDPRFLDWLFRKAAEITAPPPPSHSPVQASSSNAPGGSRLLNSALAPLSSQPEKRKSESVQDGQRKRLSDQGTLPSAPRAMGQEGRNLADRLSQPNRPMRGGLAVRGAARPNGGMNGMGMGNGNGNNRGPPMGFQPGYGPGMMQPGFGGFYPPGQGEMMAQMMMMQANMAQMGEMMSKMAQEKEAAEASPAPPTVRPARPPPVKVPHGTKLGSHSVSVIPPKASPGPIPDKPSSKALCRYGVGCSNSRCIYSHPSPAADEKNGMVLSEEICEEGRKCKDAECVKSHVSPAAVLGETAGPSRLLCKYQNCTNPSCPFRHENAQGSPIPPPALTARKAAAEKKTESVPVAAATAGSDNDDGDVEVVMSSKGLMDGALDDKKPEKSCRYGERCTRADCIFSHPPSRPTPNGARKPFPPRPINGTGFNVSKKFGSAKEKKLDASAGEFKPIAVKEPELQVTS